MFLLKSCAIFLLSISMINIHAMESSDSSSSSHASDDLSDKRKRGDEEKREKPGIQLSSPKRKKVYDDQKSQNASEQDLDSLQDFVN